MPEIGYSLASEEHGPLELVDQARQVEEAGFRSVWISDHFHSWLDSQGQSPFVWSVIGGIATTTRLEVTTAVTCPTIRIHPAIVAQAAATCALLLQGRFRLGVGSGENLNEHILGDPWPRAGIRLAMLEEAIEALPGQLAQELPLPIHFEQASELVTEDMVAKVLPCGPDPERHAAAIREYLDAGYDGVYLQQIGKDLQGFLRFYRDEVEPRLGL